jgi:hypothetical protein
MKQLRTQNLGINFLSRPAAEAMDSLDPTKLWFIPAECVVEGWISEDGLCWYRRFSNGLLMQGGTVPTTAQMVILPAPFLNNHYTLTLGFTAVTEPGTEGPHAYCQGGVKTPQSFWLRARLGSTTYAESCDWTAFGIGL